MTRPALDPAMRSSLMAAARTARDAAYAPYSRFHVGAALLFADGAIVTGSNVENASYGLSLCAETVAAARAFHEGRRGGLVAVAVAGGAETHTGVEAPVTPCGRCRQTLFELAAIGGTDPVVLCLGSGEVLETTLATLLPHAFGPASLD